MKTLRKVFGKSIRDRREIEHVQKLSNLQPIERLGTTELPNPKNAKTFKTDHNVGPKIMCRVPNIRGKIRGSKKLTGSKANSEEEE